MPSRRASAATARAAVRRAAPGSVSSAASSAAPHACGCSAGARGDVVHPREVGPRPLVVPGQRVQARSGQRDRPRDADLADHRDAVAERLELGEQGSAVLRSDRGPPPDGPVTSLWPNVVHTCAAAGAAPPSRRGWRRRWRGRRVRRRPRAERCAPGRPCPVRRSRRWPCMPGQSRSHGAALLPQQRHRGHQTAARFVQFGLLVHVRGDGVMPLGLGEVAPPHREYGLHPTQLGTQHRQLKLLAALRCPPRSAAFGGVDVAEVHRRHRRSPSQR